MSNFIKRGKPSNRKIGDEVGPYVVTGFVGDTPEKSLYVRLGCKLGCGHELTQHKSYLKHTTKACGGCRGTGVRKVAA